MTKPPSPRPLSIKLTLVIVLFFAIQVGLRAINGNSAIFIWPLRGPWAYGWGLIEAALLALGCVGLWSLRRSARLIVLWYFIYRLPLMVVVSVFLLPLSLGDAPLSTRGTFLRWILPALFWLGLHGFVIYTMIKHKAAFGTRSEEANA